MSGSSYCPMFAVYVQGTAPFSRIHATATDVSSPPEKAIPTRSPTGRELSTLDMLKVYAHHCIFMQASVAPAVRADPLGTPVVGGGVVKKGTRCRFRTSVRPMPGT